MARQKKDPHRVTQRVVRVRQAPLNTKVWNLELACGHDVWVPGHSRPTRQTAVCDTCTEAARQASVVAERMANND